MTAVIGPLQGHRDARQQRFTRIDHAIVVTVDIDHPGEARGAEFGEVVVGGVDPVGENDRRDHIVGGVAPFRASGVETIKVVGRLRLGDGVGSRHQFGELVGTIRRCGGGE